MMVGACISIAMATYNGEKYLQEQLDSLARQTYLPHELVVGDDGSSDGTIEILERFASVAPFPVRVEVNQQNLGYAENFLRTASRCAGGWIAFCDQDDVWLSNKLELCAHAIEKTDGLNMILQNAEICDNALNRSGRIFPNQIKPGIYSKMSQFGFWVWLGFLQTIKASLIKELSFDDRPANYFPGYARQSHDKWTCMIANALGGICVLGDVVALYRRHDQALTGDYAQQSMNDRIVKAWSTGAEHYRFLAGVAQDSASSLTTIAGKITKSDWIQQLNEVAGGFLKLSVIHRTRADLYESEKMWGRLKAYASLWARGGYVGPAFCALGWRSAAKDAVSVLFGCATPQVATK